VEVTDSRPQADTSSYSFGKNFSVCNALGDSVVGQFDPLWAIPSEPVHTVKNRIKPKEYNHLQVEAPGA
jgi:hypothetical protein